VNDNFAESSECQDSEAKDVLVNHRLKVRDERGEGLGQFRTVVPTEGGQ